MASLVNGNENYEVHYFKDDGIAASTFSKLLESLAESDIDSEDLLDFIEEK